MPPGCAPPGAGRVGHPYALVPSHRRPLARRPEVKGDRVEIVVDTGGGTSTYEVIASRAGRRVEVVLRRGLIEVSELTRGGTAVRTARFMASRVVAVVEHPAPRRPGAVLAGRRWPGEPSGTN